MQGDLRDMTVADLIQHNCRDQKTARLIIERNGQQATIFFKDGDVPHATLGELEGEEVIYRILSWYDGKFTLEAGLETETVTITRSWSGLLLKGAQRLDEIQQQPSTFTSEKEHHPMANINDTLAAIMKLDGTIAAALVDWSSGMTLGTIGSNSKFDIDIAAAGNTNVVRSKLDVMKDLKLKGAIEDILITLSEQYHLIRPLSSNPNLFIYVALSRAKSNLGLARHKLAEIEKDLSV